MTDLSTMPQVINVEHYAGDTLTLHIKIDPLVIAERVFTAQVRATENAARTDAIFTVYLTAEGADIVLSSADGHRLTKHGPYVGRWDVQLAMPNGDDPVTTLGYGEMRLNPDVTRPV